MDLYPDHAGQLRGVVNSRLATFSICGVPIAEDDIIPRFEGLKPSQAARPNGVE